MTFILSLRAGVGQAWLRLVRSLNWIAGIMFGGILLLNAAYPQAVTQLGSDLPSWAKIVGGVFWFGLVDYALKRSKQ